MAITHILYAPTHGEDRDEAIRLLKDASISFGVVDWSKAGAWHHPEEVCLVTSIGEFLSLNGVRYYATQHRALAAIADRIRGPRAGAV